MPSWAMFNSNATITTPSTTTDQYGKTKYDYASPASTTSVRCKISSQSESAPGNEAGALVHTIVFPSFTTIAKTDRVTVDSVVYYLLTKPQTYPGGKQTYITADIKAVG